MRCRALFDPSPSVGEPTGNRSVEHFVADLHDDAADDRLVDLDLEVHVVAVEPGERGLQAGDLGGRKCEGGGDSRDRTLAAAGGDSA